MKTDQIRIDRATSMGLPVEAICPRCFNILVVTSDNVGFIEPDGPSLIETNWVCPDCELLVKQPNAQKESSSEQKK